MVVMLSESLFDGIGPLSRLWLRSLQNGGEKNKTKQVLGVLAREYSKKHMMENINARLGKIIKKPEQDIGLFSNLQKAKIWYLAKIKNQSLQTAISKTPARQIWKCIRNHME